MHDPQAVLEQAARSAAAAREIADELLRYIQDLQRMLDALRLLGELEDLMDGQ